MGSPTFLDLRTSQQVSSEAFGEFSYISPGWVLQHLVRKEQTTVISLCMYVYVLLFVILLFVVQCDCAVVLYIT